MKIIKKIPLIGKNISGFNNPNGYSRDDIIRSLEKGKNVYKTDYNAVIIEILLNKPRHEVDRYFQRLVDQYEGMKKRGQLSQDLLLPPLDNQKEITRYMDFKMKSQNKAPVVVSVPTPVQKVQKSFKSIFSWGGR